MSNNEFVINPKDNPKKSMYYIKENLRSNSELVVISGVHGSSVASRVTENLVRLNYVSIRDIKTSTTVSEGKRKICLKITIQKTKEFDSLYEENEHKRKFIIAEKERRKQDPIA